MFRTVFVAASIAIVNPWMLIVCAISLMIMVGVLRFGAPSMIETQKLDGIYRGPIN